MADLNASRLVALSGLIDRIYAAAAEPALWPEVLTDIGRAVSDGTQTLLFLPGREHLPSVLRCRRTPDSVLFPFLDYYSSVNVLAEPCDRLFPDGTVRFSHIAVSDADFERSEFYADFFRRNHLFYSCGIKQSASEGGLNYLSMQREKALDPFSESETIVLELLMPHLRRALAMQAQLAAHANQIHSAETALAAFGKAVVAIGANGLVSFATAAAENLLVPGDPLQLRGGRLCARDPRIDEQLQQRLRSVLCLNSELVESDSRALLVPYRSVSTRGGTALPAVRGISADASQTVAESLRLTFLPMRHSGLFAGTAPGAIVCIGGSFLDRPGLLASRGSILRDLFGLTPTEARVAELLSQGADVKSIATALKKSEAATRFHLKQVFEKTGTTRQAELLRLLSDLPHPVS